MAKNIKCMSGLFTVRHKSYELFYLLFQIRTVCIFDLFVTKVIVIRIDANNCVTSSPLNSGIVTVFDKEIGKLLNPTTFVNPSKYNFFYFGIFSHVPFPLSFLKEVMAGI